MSQIGRLHIVSDCFFQSRYTHQDLLSFAMKGGADVFQLREKKRSKNEVYSIAKKLAPIKSESCRLLINDHVDIAQAVRADGVHLGRSDLPVSAARLVLDADRIIGGTANNLEEAIQVASEGADYLGVGPVFSAKSKQIELKALGLDYFAEICAAVDIPVIGIGGIKHENASDVMQAGAHGIAVMTAVSCADQPTLAIEKFASLIK